MSENVFMKPSPGANTPVAPATDSPVVVGTKKAKQAEANAARNKKRREAFSVVLAYLTAHPIDELKDALAALKPLRAATATVKDNVQDKLNRLFGTGTTVTGLQVYQFENSHMGTSDMRRNMLLAIKTGAPENRLWIEYNGKDDVYYLRGRGKDVPKNWSGYVPVDVTAETGSVPKEGN